ncbi:hypothetical protein G7Y89_g15692 [Cudoniella acicularis]|uniref:2EXR domain-containing protein n=1 Tax=Cudoniella acicularis TaxID=354080 RepID=A0A8H4VIW2_9HELO|nr:hypothetical protein G7Y89_g15692 [Cudoniella acicularis]
MFSAELKDDSLHLPDGLLSTSNIAIKYSAHTMDASFTMFPLLPTELRLEIYKLSLPGPRWIKKFPFLPAPAALSVCHEFRDVALRKYTPISNHPYSYIDWSQDIIDADFLGDFECILDAVDIARIQNLVIRRFDPDDDNPATIWQRNPTYRGWPLCAFRFNCSSLPWGAPLRGIPSSRDWVLNQCIMKSLTNCRLIAPAKTQLIFLGGKIMCYDEVLKTMQEDLEDSKKLTDGKSCCDCQSCVHPQIKLVEEICGSDGPTLIDI